MVFNMTYIPYFFGYFCLMLIIMSIAVVIANKKNPWWLFAVGVALQLVILCISTYKQSLTKEFSDAFKTLIEWTIFIVLLIIFAILIYIRGKERTRKIKEHYIHEPKINNDGGEFVACLKCGANITNDMGACHVCGEKRD